MIKKLYVGNLSYRVDADQLRQLFAAFGAVVSAMVVADGETGASKGFGFVEMGSEQEAETAIRGINGREFEGRQLRVNDALAKPRRDVNAGR
jgi:RNA recognition motif-containing protein